MAHEIDMTNGRANMAYAGREPWHGLGTRLDAEASVDEWRAAAGLDWTVGQSPVQFIDTTGNVRQYKGRKVLHRSDNGAPLNVVSDVYKPVHPTEVLEFFRDLVEDIGSFRMHTAGSLRGGKKIWALAEAEDHFRHGREDQIDRYLLLATSFDFSIPTLVQQTSIRVVCANTLGMAWASAEKGGSRYITVRHNQQFNSGDVKMRLALDDQWSAFQAAVDELSLKAVSDSAAEHYFLDVLYPAKEREGARFNKNLAEKQVGELMGAFHTSPGQDNTTARGTAWGLVNAVDYYVDHKARSHSRDRRLEKAWFGKGQALKERAGDRALAFARGA